MSGGARSAGIIGCTLLCATLLGVLAAFPLCALASASLATAAADLQSGKADEAASLLTDVLRSEPQNAEANNLLCRVEYTLEEFDEAASHCEKAVSLDSQNARYHLWLGRALGERASRASFMSAFSLAKRTRQEFETAVKLNPKDADALSDLCQFYEEAPGAVGGVLAPGGGATTARPGKGRTCGAGFTGGAIGRTPGLADTRFPDSLITAGRSAFTGTGRTGGCPANGCGLGWASGRSSTCT